MVGKGFGTNHILPEQTQVIIIGGGPVGLSVAMELGTRGVKCVVVEPRKDISKLRPRAKTTSVRTMEHFRRWNIADKIRKAAPLSVAWSQQVSFCDTLLGREITRFDKVFGLELSANELFAEAGQQIPQFIVEEILRESVQDLQSVQLMEGWSLHSIEQNDEKVIAHLRNDQSEEKIVQGVYLVGCDGARSAVRREMGIIYEGEADSLTNFNILFRSSDIAEKVPHDPAVQYWMINQHTPGLMGRLDLQDMWWMIVLGVDAETGNKNPEHYIHRMIGGKIPVEVVSTDEWSARMLLANRFRTGRVFLAGDAAHLNPPWGGHGYNTGIGDAVDIGWKLAAVLQGWGGEALLNSYEEERRPVSDRVIRVATENMKTLSSNLAGNLQDGEIDEKTYYKELADHIYDSKKMEFHSLDLVLGYRYDHSHIVADDLSEWPQEDTSVYHPTSHPGARLPHCWLNDNQSIYDVLGSGFTLLSFNDEVNVDQFVKEAEEKRVPLKVVPLYGYKLHELYEKSFIIVRPDQHVAWRGDHLPENISELLDQIRGASTSVVTGKSR
jgi:2-polyprenyl-6-methoxyphenol hydroxylase-like FAD-dependent oxidoreductase